MTFEGNQAAQGIIQRVFQPVDRNWRGIGTIPQSGWGLRPEMSDFDAEKRFDVEQHPDQRIDRVYRRADPARVEEAARMPGFWRAVHCRKPARRADGFIRGRLLRVLPLWQKPVSLIEMLSRT